jgi:predicted nuclease with TOPRIM domain
LEEISEKVSPVADIKDALIADLEKKYEEQQNRMDRLEIKLEKVISLLEENENGKLTKKVDNVEKQMKKLTQSVEKLTAYVE